MIAHNFRTRSIRSLDRESILPASNFPRSNMRPLTKFATIFREGNPVFRARAFSRGNEETKLGESAGEGKQPRVWESVFSRTRGQRESTAGCLENEICFLYIWEEKLAHDGQRMTSNVDVTFRRSIKVIKRIRPGKCVYPAWSYPRIRGMDIYIYFFLKNSETALLLVEAGWKSWTGATRLLWTTE